jgi:SHS family sialic acid transporter-like MFS transporter
MVNRELDASSTPSHESTGPASNTARWLALTAALLGWMFDGAEMGVFPMVGRPAIKDLLQASDEASVNRWFGIVIAGFLVGAATGGVLFGWLGDRIGRVRAMTFSVLTYAVFTGLCGVVTSAAQLGILRFIAALGMGGEWSLGVALVMEVWPNRSRAFMAGLIGAAGNVGYMLVGFVGMGLATFLTRAREWLITAGLSDAFAERLTKYEGWRLMMILGTLPALLTFFIRIFVPESERWQRERGRGATSSWATRDLGGVVIGALGPALIVYLWSWDGPAGMPHTTGLRVFGTLLGLAVATFGYTFPVIRYLKRRSQEATGEQAVGPTMRRMLLGACLSGVALLGTWGSSQWAPAWASKLTEKATAEGVMHYAKENTQIWLAIGAIVGTIVAALMGDWLGRRGTYSLFCILSLGSSLLFFQTNQEYGTRFLVTAFLIGLCTASFYGWLPLYLPELFRTNVRATGQGFSFNFGRILAAVGALQTGILFKSDIQLGSLKLPAGYPSACSLISMIYLVGLVLIWFAPETKGRALPE